MASVSFCEPFVFPEELQEALIVQRENRFIISARLRLPQGTFAKEAVLCHCPATTRIGDTFGSLQLGGMACLVSSHKNTPNSTSPRKTEFTVEAVSLDEPTLKEKSWIGINQTASNRYVEHFLRTNQFSRMLPNGDLAQRERKLGNSRIDFRIGASIFLEVKTMLMNLPNCSTHSHYKKGGVPPLSPDRLCKHYLELGDWLVGNAVNAVKEKEMKQKKTKGGKGKGKGKTNAKAAKTKKEDALKEEETDKQAEEEAGTEQETRKRGKPATKSNGRVKKQRKEQEVKESVCRDSVQCGASSAPAFSLVPSSSSSSSSSCAYSAPSSSALSLPLANTNPPISPDVSAPPPTHTPTVSIPILSSLTQTGSSTGTSFWSSRLRPRPSSALPASATSTQVSSALLPSSDSDTSSSSSSSSSSAAHSHDTVDSKSTDIPAHIHAGSLDSTQSSQSDKEKPRAIILLVHLFDAPRFVPPTGSDGLSSQVLKKRAEIVAAISKALEQGVETWQCNLLVDKKKVVLSDYYKLAL